MCTEIYEVDFKSGKQFSPMLNVSVFALKLYQGIWIYDFVSLEYTTSHIQMPWWNIKKM